jgi:hypothetical protein
VLGMSSKKAFVNVNPPAYFGVLAFFKSRGRHHVPENRQCSDGEQLVMQVPSGDLIAFARDRLHSTGSFSYYVEKDSGPLQRVDFTRAGSGGIKKAIASIRKLQGC